MKKLPIVLLVIVVLLIIFFPKKSSYWHKPAYYNTYGGDPMDNYGTLCECYGVEIDNSDDYEYKKYCFGIPDCKGIY